MCHFWSRRIAASLALAASCAIALTAQSGGTQPPTEEQPPIFRTEANFVRVDVYPTKNGQPVPGLRAEDFEVREDGVPQRIEAFEHVAIRPAGPQTERIEPSSQREALQAVANPRNRVFVVFLDVRNVGVEGAYHINEPLIRMLSRILGPDDLVGIMTPAMAASQIVLARKTQVIEDSLRENWAWGTRFSLQLDEREAAYEMCYPPTDSEAARGLTRSELASELIRRKRERATFEALQDLVRYLHGVREERKAILAVSEGWLLFRPDPSLMKLRQLSRDVQEPIPTLDPIGVGPTGKLTPRDHRNITGGLTKNECDTDRLRLAEIDNDMFLRDIINEANRANASFYPIDPRGLPVFDNPIGPDKPPPPAFDQAMLRARHESMRTLAGATDGMAVLNSNDLDGGLRRISDDLTSYYLLGYYSTNPNLDGGYRRLNVRVKQAGVEVRARRGYRAVSAEEAAAARIAAEPAAPTSSSAFTAAMGTLSRIRADAPMRINAVASPDDESLLIWVAGELAPESLRGTDLETGSTALIEATSGDRSSTARVALKPGERTFLTMMRMQGGGGGQLDVKVRLSGEGGRLALTDAVLVDVGPAATQPLLFRRGPSTGNRVLPAADFRFSRTERLVLEIPVGSAVKPGEARVLDKAGQPLQIPVTVAEKTDSSTGQRWLTAEVLLAPLAPGDYAVEVSTLAGGADQRVVTAIRVTR